MLFARFRPGITQPDGAVEHQIGCGCIAAVEAEIAFTLKLVSFTGFGLRQARLRISLLNHQRIRVDYREEIFLGPGFGTLNRRS